MCNINLDFCVADKFRCGRFLKCMESKCMVHGCNTGIYICNVTYIQNIKWKRHQIT